MNPKQDWISKYRLCRSNLWIITQLRNREGSCWKLDLCSGWSVVVLDLKGVSRSTLPSSVLSSLELCLRPLSSNSPRAWRKSTPSDSLPLLWIPLSWALPALPCPNLTSATQQHRIKRGGGERGGRFIVCLQQNKWKPVTLFKCKFKIFALECFHVIQLYTCT